MVHPHSTPAVPLRKNYTNPSVKKQTKTTTLWFKKNWTPTKFSNNFNNYWPILIICVQKIYKESQGSLHICSLRVLIKQGTSLGYFHGKTKQINVQQVENIVTIVAVNCPGVL